MVIEFLNRDDDDIVSGLWQKFEYVEAENMPTDLVDPSGLNAADPDTSYGGILWTIWYGSNDNGWKQISQWFEPYPGGGEGDGGGPEGSSQERNPCARMAARAQRVWGEVLKSTTNDGNLAPNTSFNRAALPAFDQNFNALYTGQVVDGSGASISFYAHQNQLNSAPANEQGQQDFKDIYVDRDAGQDQTHHLAFHFSAGLNNAVLSSYLQLADEHLSGMIQGANPGDVALTNAAYAFGQKMRNNPNLMTNIGKEFSDEFCK